MLADECGVPDADVVLRRDESGRLVVISPTSELRCSLSHSGGLALVAVTLGVDVGVDLESTRRDTSDWAVWRHVLTAEELSSTPRTGPDRLRSLLAFWTAKEAVLKAAGVGLAVDPREIELRAGRLVTLPSALGDVRSWSLAYVPIDGFVAAVVCRSPRMRLDWVRPAVFRAV
jgi:4'-phosphopantetheinyl transferase